MRRIVLAVVISVFCFCSGLAALAQTRPSRPVPVIEAPSARLPEQPTPLRPVARRELPSRSAPEIAPADVPHIILPALDAARLRQERDQRQRLRQQEEDQLLNRRPNRGFRLPQPQKQEIGINRDVHLSSADGKWFTLPGGRVWMLDITSPGSLTTRLHFINFALPPGMKLYVGAPGGNQEPAEFADRGPFPSGDFWSPPVAGDTVHLELLDESSPDNPPPAVLPFQISSLDHVYDDPMAYDFGEPALCERDAACYPDWSNVGDSVARILFSNGGYVYACSAVLLNNLSGDFSPLLLTAHHCIGTDAAAQTLAAYWFYKSLSCNGTANINQALISNYATLLASNTPVDNSDTSLVQILGPLPNTVVWAAWSTQEPGIGAALTGIHHPKASYRRISFGNRTLDGFPGQYSVLWNSGIMEHGSSGSPLFNSAQQVLGQLYGGLSSCSSSGPDTYGKLSVAYPSLVGTDGRKYLEQGLPDDLLEPNNNRQQAYSVSLPASFQKLVVKKLADDWFKISLPANQGFTADISNSNTNYGPVEIEIYRDSETVPIASGDRHAAAGAGNAPVEFYVRVFLRSDLLGGLEGGVRNLYDISFASQQVSPPVPPTVQTLQANSGYGSIYATGSCFSSGSTYLTFWFEWATDSSLSNFSQTPPQVGSVNCASTITGLVPGTTYYYRLVVLWVDGPIRGNVATVQTAQLGSSNYSPLDGQTLVTEAFLRWDGNGETWDVYFGADANPPLLLTTSSKNVPVGSLSRSSRYYWRVVARYLSFAVSSPVLSFTTPNVLCASPAVSYSFGSSPLGRSSPEQTLTLCAMQPVQIADVSISGDFVQQNNCVGTIVDFFVGNCVVHMSFRPTALGLRTGNLVISTTSFPAVPFVIPLTGTGTDLVLTLARPSRPQRAAALPAGQARQFDFSVGTSAPLPGTIALACEVIPSHADCSLSSSEVLASSGGQPVTVTLETRARRASASTRFRRDPDNPDSDSPGTPPGSYTVRVTATYSGLTRSLDIPVQVR